MQRWDKLMKDNDVIGQVRKFSKGKGTPTQFSITMPDGSTKQVQPINADVVNGFYSPLEKIINETKFDKLPAKQWIDKFAKGEEAKWTGLTDWLAQQQGSVSKADIQQYLKDNRIEVVEVVKGYYSKQVDELYKKLEAKNKGREFDDWDVKDQDEWMAKRGEPQETKFSQYQLEGEKENYKEVLVTFPQSKQQKEINRLADKYGVENTYISLRTSNATDSELEFVRSLKNDQFKSSHFDEKNILVHLRMNTRTDAEGKKVLFLEEVQSDWGQKGKKEGFEIKEEDRWNFEPIKRNGETVAWKIELKSDKNIGGIGNTKEDAIKDANKRYGTEINTLEKQQKGTPSAPFVTDTNAWTKLGLKVALKEAVKQGADKIAWSTGTQQFNRWGSEEISWRKNTARTPQEEARMKELGEKIVNYKDTNEERIEHEKLARKEGGFSVLINEQTTGATAFNGQEIGNRDDVTIQTKDDLRKAIKRNLSRERNEAEIDKLTDRIWNRMQTEDSGTSLPRKEGMEGFYGVPSENKLGIVGNVAKSLFKQEPKIV
jgi:hypothetical protein